MTAVATDPARCLTSNCQFWPASVTADRAAASLAPSPTLWPGWDSRSCNVPPAALRSSKEVESIVRCRQILFASRDPRM